MGFPPVSVGDAAPVRLSLARRRAATVAIAAMAGLMIVLAGYLALTVPGPWFASRPPRIVGANQIAVVRGSAALEGERLIIRRPGSDGAVLLSATVDMRAVEWPAVQWKTADLPDNVRVSMLWRTDVAPLKVSSVPLTVAFGRVSPAVLSHHPDWLGRVVGVALLIERVPAKPFVVYGVRFSAMTARDVLGDRAAEWLAFEPWTGTSIRSITGGADIQSLPLAALAAASIVASALLWLAGTWIARAPRNGLPLVLALLFLAWWAILDARWTWNLARQASNTVRRYGGLDANARQLAAEDGEVFAWIQHNRAALPQPPARLFIAAEEPYFRGRLAYHLYPLNVFYSPLQDAMPSRDWLRSGDWMLVFRRRGVEYDAARHELLWGAGPPVAAHLKVASAGVALFQID